MVFKMCALAWFDYLVLYYSQEPSPRLKNREAIYANQINLIKLLVGNGANLNAKDDKGHTPKDLAIMCDFYECADVLSELAGEF